MTESTRPYRTKDRQTSVGDMASPATTTSCGKRSDAGLFHGLSSEQRIPVRTENHEKEALTRHLHTHLGEDAFVQHLLPLDPKAVNFFDKFRDGILLCRLVNLAMPGIIADSAMNVPLGSEPVGFFNAMENLNAALSAAVAGGLQLVNIGARDIMDGRPASILGLSWQLIRVHLLAVIKPKDAEQSQQPLLGCQPSMQDDSKQVAGPSWPTLSTSAWTLPLWEQSPESTSIGITFLSALDSKSGVGDGSDGDRDRWSSNVLRGESCTIFIRHRSNETCAAVAVQHRGWQVTGGRRERARCMKEVTHRKDAARTLHRAHENDCPSKLSTRRRKFTKNVGVDAEQEQQEEKEEEEEEACRPGYEKGRRSRGRLFPFANDLARKLTSVYDGEEQEEEGEDEAEPETENDRKPREPRKVKPTRTSNSEARAEGYMVVDLLKRSLAVEKVREARARQLTHAGTGARSWTSPVIFLVFHGVHYDAGSSAGRHCGRRRFTRCRMYRRG